ncbi:MAG: SRPBCC family protein [Acidobacteria bacterium]|nr:SRPBCC family protein [Acidobacteriota bacterium]
MIKAVINVTAPRQQVFSILSDYPNYKRWVPGCERCNVTASSGNTADTEIIISSMKRIELGVRFEAQPGQALSFRMTKGKDLKAYSGTYRLMESTDGTGTVVIAELEIDVGMMVPKFMVDRMTRKMMDDTGVALRKYIASAPAMAFPTAALRAAAPAAKRRRARKILRVTKTASGYNVWLMGETFEVKTPSA